MKLLLVYPPFCTPTVMPFSISNIKSFVENNSEISVKCLDINAKFHRLRFPEFYGHLYDSDIWTLLDEFNKQSRQVYAANNKRVVENIDPELLDEMLCMIAEEKADVVGFSIVYNSQNFYAKALIDRIKMPCIVGGPAVSSILKDAATYVQDEIQLLDYLGVKTGHLATSPDFSDYSRSDYLSKTVIIPVKSSTGCYYKNCTFCTHHGNRPYTEHSLQDITKSSYYFLIDDMLPVKRLVYVAGLLKPAKWWVQLKPTAEIIGHLDYLARSGLKCIGWGVESGSQATLDRMNKGTNIKDIELVLKASKDAGILNVVYIMFGFPGETKEQFLETISFLKQNSDAIHLVSTTIFGLQKGSDIYNQPHKYGVIEIKEEKRTILDTKITYDVSGGLSSSEAASLRKRYDKTIQNINKLPKAINYMKEQALLYDGPK